MSDVGHENDIKFRPETSADWRMLREVTMHTLFYYGPDLWRLGHTDHWEYDDSGETLRHYLPRSGVELALKACGSVTLTPAESLYRIRLNIPEPSTTDPLQFDTPPLGVKKKFDRFDDADIPVFYAGRTIDVCLHEARLSNRDSVTVATVEVTEPLRLLDITGKSGGPARTPFDDVEIFFNGLVFSNQTHEECRLVARCIREAGYDGFVYKSYHSPVMASPGENVVLFGWPISEGKVQVRSVNNVFLEQIRTDYQLGPVVGQVEASDDLTKRLAKTPPKEAVVP